MAVYIDPMVDWGKRQGHAGPLWCHLIADSLEELHAFAERLGLRREWFDSHPRHPHYDIGTLRLRLRAVQLGALQCDRRQFVEHMQRIERERKEASGG